MIPKGQWREVQKRMKEMDEDGQEKFTQRLLLAYRQHGIPLEIRDDMSALIESLSLDEIEPEEEEIKGREIYEKIIAELQNLVKNREFPLNVTLQGKAAEIQNRFRENPGDLVRNLKNCLIFERLLIDSINKESEFDVERGVYMEGSSRILEAMRSIRQRSDQFEKTLQTLQTKTAGFLQFYAFKEERTAKITKAMQGNVTEDQKREYQRQKNLMEQQSGQETIEVYESRKNTQEILVQLYYDVQKQVQEVWKYLDTYEKQQKLNVLDIKMGPPEGAVKDLNDMCEAVNEMLIRVMQYFDLVMDECNRIKIVDDPTPDNLIKHQTLFIQEAEKHFNRIVVIDHHPHQILKISKGRSLTFAMTLRILGPVSLGLNVNIPTVTVNLHPEKDLPSEMRPGKEVSKGICTIHNASKVKAQFKASTKQLMVNFTSAQILSVKRPESRSRDERVTEIKYGMIFSISLNIAGQERLIKKLSLPLILTSQSSQEWAAKGTLFWDAYFSDENRQYFQDAPKVNWGQVADLMDKIFKGHTKRGLTKEQLDYLAQRVFDTKEEQQDFSKFTITKEKFLKDSLQNTNFSLWKWVYACLNLIKESLSKEWEKGLILGFVSREGANALLSDRPAGTFLLRFGTTRLHETQSATITAILAPVAVVTVPGGTRVSHMDANLTQQKLSRQDLARYLQLLQIQDPHNKDVKRQALRILYPDIPFEEAFRELLHASEIANENYDQIIDKPEVLIREFDHFMINPASPDSSITSAASVYQDDSVLSPCGSVPQGGACMNDDNDILERIGSSNVGVDDLVPTLRINEYEIRSLQSPSMQSETSCTSPYQVPILGQGTGAKRQCVSSDGIVGEAVYPTNTPPEGSGAMSAFAASMGMGGNPMQVQLSPASIMSSQGQYFGEGSSSMTQNPALFSHGLPDYSSQGSSQYMNTNTSPPVSQQSFGSGQVFPLTQIDTPLVTQMAHMNASTSRGSNFLPQEPPSYANHMAQSSNQPSLQQNSGNFNPAMQFNASQPME